MCVCVRIHVKNMQQHVRSRLCNPTLERSAVRLHRCHWARPDWHITPRCHHKALVSWWICQRGKNGCQTGVIEGLWSRTAGVLRWLHREKWKLIGRQNIFLSANQALFMQIPASNFSFIHTSVISVRPQTSEKRGRFCQTARSQRRWFAWKMASCDWLNCQIQIGSEVLKLGFCKKKVWVKLKAGQKSS